MFITGDNTERATTTATPPRALAPGGNASPVPIYHRFLPRAAIFHPRSAPILIVTFPPYLRPHYLFRPLVTRRLSLPTALRL
jgi:hypothetical protein